MTLAQPEFAIAHRSRRRLTLVSPTSSPTPALRVVIAGGPTLLRAGFRALLESESNAAVAGEAGSDDEAVDLVRAGRPDVVLMCPAAPGFDRVDAIRRIAAQSHAGVIVLSGGEDDEPAFDALRAGARGFLPLDTDPAELVRAVRIVAGGDAFLSPEVMRTLIAELTAYGTGGSPTPVQLEELTAREREVMALAATGLSNDEIGRELVVSPATAKTHLSRAMMKLRARDRSQLVALAYRSGLVRPRGRTAALARPALSLV